MRFSEKLKFLLFFCGLCALLPSIVLAQEAPKSGRLSHLDETTPQEKYLTVIDYSCEQTSSISITCDIGKTHFKKLKSAFVLIDEYGSDDLGYQKLSTELDADTDKRCELFEAYARLIGGGNQAFADYFSKQPQSLIDEYNKTMQELEYFSFAYAEAFDKFCRRRSRENYKELLEIEDKSCYIDNSYSSFVFKLSDKKFNDWPQWVYSREIKGDCGLVHFYTFKKQEKEWILIENAKTEYPNKEIPGYGSCEQENMDDRVFTSTPRGSIEMGCSKIWLQ